MSVGLSRDSTTSSSPAGLRDSFAVEVANWLFSELDFGGEGVVSCSNLAGFLQGRFGWKESFCQEMCSAIDSSNRGLVKYSEVVTFLESNSKLSREFASEISKKMKSGSSLTRARMFYASTTNLHSLASQADGGLIERRAWAAELGGPMFNDGMGIPISGTGGGGTVYMDPLLHKSRPLLQSPQKMFHPHGSRASEGGDSVKMDDAVLTGVDVSGDDDSDLMSSSMFDESSDETERSAATMALDSEQSLEQWVRDRRGMHAIKKMLVANNGISAVKCIRCVREWCFKTFGNRHLIHLVCMATADDLSSNAEFLRMADEVITVPGGSNNYNFANVPLVVSLAKQCRCDAVWPGWGHASENPLLPQSLADEGIVWVGPDAFSMYLSGDKIMSTLIAQSCGVPCIPWSGDSIRLKCKKKSSLYSRLRRKTRPSSEEDAAGVAGSDGLSATESGTAGGTTAVESQLSPELLAAFHNSCVKNEAEVIEHSRRIGFPVMIKASEGGGGKGIRKAKSEEEVKAAYRQVLQEVPGSPVFIMKLANNARHLEIQILADKFNNCIALFGRDCSIQRRHQKIIEEGPIVNVPPRTLAKLEESAIALCKAVHYVGAGTVEFLYDTVTEQFCFLELNPRLQVEHPVTEMISAINLPAAQVQVAMGIPLYCIADIRALYSGHKVESLLSPIELTYDNRLPAKGHTIACRITAENPLNKFAPTTGRIGELQFRSLPDVWGYFSLKSSGRIHEFSDSQFGHIFARGESREEARKNMILALATLEIRGEIKTTVEFLQSILQNKEYKAGRIDTTWLERTMLGSLSVDMDGAKKGGPRSIGDSLIVPAFLTPEKIVLLGSVAEGYTALEKKRCEVLNELKHGRNIPEYVALVSYDCELIYQNIKYKVTVIRTGKSSLSLRQYQVSQTGISDEKQGTETEDKGVWRGDVTVEKLSDGGLMVLFDTRSFTVYPSWSPADESLSMTIDGNYSFSFEREYDPSIIRAEMPGKLIRLLVENKSHIDKGQPFAEIEVMKMYMPLTSPESGIIDIQVSPGTILQIGQLLARLKLDDLSRVKTAKKFTRRFSRVKQPEANPLRVDRLFNRSRNLVWNMMNGFVADTERDPDYVRIAIDNMLNALRDPQLAVDEFSTLLEPLKGRLKPRVYAELESVIRKHRIRDLQPNRFQWERQKDFPYVAILQCLDSERYWLESEGQSEEMAAFDTLTADLRQCGERHSRGSHFLAVQEIVALLREFMNKEAVFIKHGSNLTKVIKELKSVSEMTDESWSSLVNTLRGHFQFKDREVVVLNLLEIADSIYQNKMFEFISVLSPVLEQMCALLIGMPYAKIYLKAREILLSLQAPSEAQRKMEIEDMLGRSEASRAGSTESGSRTPAFAVKSDVSEPGTVAASTSATTTATVQGDNSRDILKQLPDILEILPTYMLSGSEVMSTNAAQLWVRSVFCPPVYQLNKLGMRVNHVPFTSTQCWFDYYLSRSGSSEISETSDIIADGADLKHGCFAFFKSMDTLQSGFASLLAQFPKRPSGEDIYYPRNVLILGVRLSLSAVDAQPAGKSAKAKAAAHAKADAALANAAVFDENAFVADFERFLSSFKRQLVQECGISFVSVLVHTVSNDDSHSGGSVSGSQRAGKVKLASSNTPPLFTFRQTLDFKEDPITRNILPPLVKMLEMDRLKVNFDVRWIPTDNRRIHIFEGIPKKKSEADSKAGRRLFIRVPVPQLVAPHTMIEDVFSNFMRFAGPEFALMEAMHSLEFIMNKHRGFAKWQYNHLFLSAFFDVDFSTTIALMRKTGDKSGSMINGKEWLTKFVSYVLGRMHRNHEIFHESFHRLRISHTEMRLQFRMLNEGAAGSSSSSSSTSSSSLDIAPFAMRIFLDDPGHGVLSVHAYLEKPLSDGSTLLVDVLSDKKGPLHKSPSNLPHPVFYKLMQKRRQAMLLKSTYVYDWSVLFERVILTLWAEYNTRKEQAEKRYSLKSMDELPASFAAGKECDDEEDDSAEDMIRDAVSFLPADGKGDPSEERDVMFSARLDIPSDTLDFAKDSLVSAKELILGEDKKSLVQVEREAGLNDIGMVAWLYRFRTPQAPLGRSVYIVANDITFRLGTFSQDEGLLYDLVCQRACKEGLPFVYLSANSGARIGLDETIRKLFKVKWQQQSEDETKTSSEQGKFEPEYLFIEKDDLTDEISKLVRVEEVKREDSEEVEHYRIRDVIGTKGIGVENLSGSGLIAGSTSRAYRRTFTLSYVTGRSVGIGAYLVRLGQRVIQRTDSPILLTGYIALNNLLGRSVYTSNLQIGGADEIFSPNGVNHRQVDSDIEGAMEILRWLEFVPHSNSKPVLMDPVSRSVDFTPVTGKEDPRLLICGCVGKEELMSDDQDPATAPSTSELVTQPFDAPLAQQSGASDSSSALLRGLPALKDSWQSGLFDKDSWMEYLSAWAKSVVIGRARLGGIAVGVIAAETRPQCPVIPPDPATEGSIEVAVPQAGQVWYPDSSYKTAQAISDFNGEGLPLFILANWRGFSGGQRDMFDEVLKFGSMIVDELAQYSQPVFIYIPPLAELRGGAWVVLDSLINEESIEMFAAESARANVLEPTGSIGLKYRKTHLLATMHRLDNKLRDLDLRVAETKEESEVRSIQLEIEDRERSLLPVYQRIALMFAELHDTPGRMHKVGVIDEVVPWKWSRCFFYWRLRRKLIEHAAVAVLKSQGLSRPDWVRFLQQQLDAQPGQLISEVCSRDRELVKAWMDGPMQADFDAFVQRECEQRTGDLPMGSDEMKQEILRLRGILDAKGIAY